MRAAKCGGKLVSFNGGVRERGVSGRDDDFGGVEAAALCAAA